MKPDQETMISEACTRRRWRQCKHDCNFIHEEGWFKGVRIERIKTYGTMSNPHAPSRWRVTGYVAGGKGFDSFRLALAYALSK